MASKPAAAELPRDLHARLVRELGESAVLTDPELKATYETDWTRRFHGRACAVVCPRSSAQVAAVLRGCADAAVPVVPQGGNTGLVGGGVPRGGELVLSTTALDGECVVDRAAGEIVAAAGVTLARVQQAAREAGFDFGVDISPRESCTIGGMIATNAGGVHVLRHGMMAEQVIGVEAVLADGSTIGRIPALRKDNAGYHLASLLAGSEGTLAVVTRAHLRLTPAMPARAVALLGVDGAEAAVELVRRVRGALSSLTALEVAFRECIELVVAKLGLPAPLASSPAAVVLVECAGRRSPLDELVAAVAQCGDLVQGSAVGDDESAVRRLWRYREAVSEAINAAGVPHKLDVAVPLARIPSFVDTVRAHVAARAPGAQVAVFGHLGDGNLHVNVLGLAPDDDALDREVLRLAAEAGGTIAAEHGVGVAKAGDLALVRGPGDLAAMRAAKDALDPRGILNPGVIFPR